MISWAQNFEDVVLARAFAGRTDGFYVDVGAFDPEDGSVTRHFYDLGWRGVNVEPQAEAFARLAAQRQEDVNVRAAIGRTAGTLRLWRGATPGETSATCPPGGTASFEVPCLTLAELCRRHADRPIDFLKIDVEGMELDVIQSGDWTRFRPAVVVAEVTRPWSNERREDADAIAAALGRAGYDEAWFDGLNAFFVAREAKDVRARLALPPNVLDGFVPAAQARLVESLGEACALRAQAEARAEGAQREARDAVTRHAEAQAGWAAEQEARRADAMRMEDALRRAGEADAQRAAALARLEEARRLRDVQAQLAAELRTAADADRARLEASTATIAALHARIATGEAARAALRRALDLVFARRQAERVLDEARWQEAERGRGDALAAVAEREARLSAAGEAMASGAAEVARLQREIAGQSAALHEAQALARHWHARAEHAEASFAAMERSKSWRITAPLRAMRHWRGTAMTTPAMAPWAARTMTAWRRAAWFAPYAGFVRERFPGLWMRAKRFVAERSSPVATPPASPPVLPSIARSVPAGAMPATSPTGDDFAARLAAEVRRQRSGD